jgi:hypothetical protein
MIAPRSLIPFFGQAYTLTVGYVDPQNPGQLKYIDIAKTSWEPEALQFTFEVVQSTIPDPWWYADITIFNLNDTAIQNAIYTARRVILSAGFQTGPTQSAIIWDGPVFQISYTQENVVDQVIVLHCAANPQVMNKMLAFSMGFYSSQADLLSKAASVINLPPMQAGGNVNTLSQYAATLLQETKYPRGNTVFGKMGKSLSQIADTHFLTTFRDGQKAYMTEISNGKVPPVDYTFCPSQPPDTVWTIPPNTTPTIIGTPRQFPQGVIFTVLLDPRLQVQLPIQVVQLVRVLPSQLTLTPNLTSGDFIAPLKEPLKFFVGQVKHVGDSRGNDWYTEVTGYSTTYANDLLSGGFSTST